MQQKKNSITKLNFGCGTKILDDYLNVDFQKSDKIDKSFDFNKFPYPFTKDSFDYVLCDNVLEHLDDPKKVLEELHRICRNNSIIFIRVPHFRSSSAFNDVTHKHFFNPRAIEQLVIGSNYSHNKKEIFEIIELKQVPSRAGKFIFGFMRKYFNFLFNNIYNQIELQIKVKK